MAVVRGEPDLSANVTGGPLTPGEDTTLSVQVQNAGRVIEGSTQNPELNSRVTTARGLKVSLRKWDKSPVTIESGTVFLGSLQDGALKTADFEVSVDENATPGTYQFKVEMEYEYTSYIGENSGAQNDRSDRNIAYVTVRIDDDARFEVVDVSSDVLVGDDGTVAVTMQNVGSQAARDATVSLTSQNGLVTLGGDASANQYVGRWAPGENRTLVYDASVARGASQQPYSLAAQVNYLDEDGIPSTSKSLSTSLVPGAEQTFALRDADGTLQVGREGTVTGTVENTGPKAVYDAVVTVQTQTTGVTFEEREYALGTLEPGDAVDFSLPVELTDSANQGQRQFTYVVEYQNADDDARQSKRLNARVTVEPKEPLFSVETTNATVEAGGTATVSLQVTNNGDETLRNIDAKAFVDDPLSLSNDEGFIPELVPGETREFTLRVSSGGSALPRMYSLSIDFQYENADYETKLSDTYTVGVGVVEPADGGGGLPIPLVVGGLVVLLAIGGFVWYRRR